MNENQRSLIVGDTGIGDVFLARPLIHKLIQSNHTVDILLDSYCATGANIIPEINKVHIFDFNSGKLELGKRIKYGLKLRKYSYHNAYIMQRKIKPALIPYFANIPNRIGYRNEFRSLLLTDARKFIYDNHFSENAAGLAYKKNEKIHLSVPELKLSEQIIKNTIDKYNLNKIDKYIVICPGARLISKIWSINNFNQLVKLLVNDGFQIVLLGSKSDNVYSQQIIEHSKTNNIIDLTGKTSIEEAAAIMKASFATISNDSGLMHIAAAMSVFTIGIFLSPIINVYYPLGKRAFCTHQSQATSSVKEVYDLFMYIIDNKLNI